MAESVGDFFVNFFFKTDKASADAADKTLQNLKTRYTGLTDSAFRFNEITSSFRTALAPVSALAKSILGVANEADHMNDFAQAVGTSVQSLQKMQYVGEMAGSSTEAVNQGMRTLSRQLLQAAGGSEESQKAFAELGVKVKDAGGNMREVGQVMPDVIQKIAGLKTDGQKAEAAMKAFGKAGLDLLPMLKKSKEELAAAGAEFDAFGGGFDDKFVKNSAAFGDNMDRSRLVLNNMRREIAASVLPTLNRMFDRFLEWGKGNWPIIKDALNAFGATVAKVFEGTAVTAIDSFIKTFLQLYQDKEKWAELVGYIKAVGVAFAAWAVWKSPVLLLVAAIEDLLGMVQGKDSIFGRLSLEVKDFVENLAKTVPWIGKIVDYVKYLNGLGQMDHTKARESGASMTDFFLGKAVNTLGGQTMEDASFQQKNIEKRKVLEDLFAMDNFGPQRAKAAQGMLNSAQTGADIKRIGEVAANVVINVNGSVGMDHRQLAVEARKQVEAAMRDVLSDANDVLAPQVP